MLWSGFVVCFAFGVSGLAAASAPVIVSAVVNPASGQITIMGGRLTPASGPPVVILDASTLSLVSYTAGKIVANLPAGLGAGTFQLTVNNGSAAASFDVTKGAVGPQGPAGPAGPQGPAGVALPFSGSTTAETAAFLVFTSGAGEPALVGIAGAASACSGCQGGPGLNVIGGYSSGAGSIAGPAVFASAGTATAAGDGGGYGGIFYGGGSDTLAVSAGSGISASGGDSATGGSAGNGINAFAGRGPSGLTTGLAGYFGGSVYVFGNLSKSGGAFLIDHPTDPANKYLYHSFVESPDMMNVYNGNAVTDSSGTAIVDMPEWMETLNRDFRYQLTVIGQAAEVWIGAEIANHAFAIRTDKPNVKVSWQVTGIRQDAWANLDRIPLEVDKDAADRGHYLHPELFGHAGDLSIPDMHQPPARPPDQRPR